MKRIKLIAVIMSLIMIFLTGCTAEKKKSRDDIYLYYINKDETKRL